MKINLKKNINYKQKLKKIFIKIISKNYLTGTLDLTDKSTIFVFVCFITILAIGCLILGFSAINKDFAYSLPIVKNVLEFFSSYVELWENWGFDTTNQNVLNGIMALFMGFFIVPFWLFGWFYINKINKENNELDEEDKKSILLSYSTNELNKEILLRYECDLKFRRFYNLILAMLLFIIFVVTLSFMIVGK